jgi:hypothetical protein
MIIPYDSYLPGYPSIQDEEFYNRIVEKKEFWSGQDDMFFRHQLNIARYMTQWTLYDSLFIYHEMGTGKSAVTVAMTELAKQDKFYKKVIYIAHNQTQIANYKNEIKRFSTRLSFLLERDMKSLPEDRMRGRWNSILAKDHYEFYTFGTIASEFSRRTDQWIKEHYDKSIIIIDEAHHLVQTNKEEDKKSYNTIIKFLGLLAFKKLLVMSGTPIRDQPDEIIPLLNLVLPKEKHLSRSEFISTFFRVKENIKIFEKVEIPVYEWKPEGRLDFIRHIQGYVSYVKRRLSNAVIRYEGRIYDPMKNIKIVAHRMDPFQNSIYTEIFMKERWGEGEEMGTAKSSFYSASKQASLFVFPNQETGEKGYKQFVSPQFVLRPNFLETIGDYKNMTVGSILDLLKQFSVSYAYVLGQILNNPKELIYVFSDLVEGSGILLFMSILKTLFGFKLITSKKDLVDAKGDRMILLNDRVANEEDFQDFINYFNRPENKYGEYCQIVMSTNKTKEGISLKNVRQIHILTPSWNIADTSQAMARSLRARSHIDLENPIVKIFLHVSVPFTGEEEDEEKWLDEKLPITRDELLFSVDFQRYYRSEIKERNAKLLDRVFLESSWDCLMNLPHNTQSGRLEDYSRECEYDVCEYKCYGVSGDNRLVASDFSNFNAYYSDEEEVIIMNRIQDYFRHYHRAILSDFYSVFPNDNQMLVEKCLGVIIHQPIVLRDYRNLPCFLSYKNGVLFLTDNPYLPVSRENYEIYYQKNPATRVIFPLPDMLDIYFMRHQRIILPKLVRLINMENPNAKKLFLSLPFDFQSIFCETTLQSQILHPSQVSMDALGWFVKEFKTDIEHVPNILIKHRFLLNKKDYRKLDLKNPKTGWVLISG